MPRTRGCFSKEAGKFSSLPSAVAVQPTDSIRDFNVCSAFKKPDSPLLFKRQQSTQGGKKMMFANMIVSFKLWVNAAFLLSWHCFDTYMWVFNMLIKCLVPHRHWPLLALSWKFPEEPVLPGRSSTGTQPGDNESQALPGLLGFSGTLLVQEKMKTEPKALTLCFSLGRKIFLSNILEEWFMYRMFISAENHPHFHTQKNITMISYMRNL